MSEIQYPKPAKRFDANSWLRALTLLVLAIFIAFGVRTFAYQPFVIPSASMEPTLLPGDTVIVSKFAYGYSRFSFPRSMGLSSLPVDGRLHYVQPKRGDVVVFISPGDGRTFLIKRLIGLPGDKVQMIEGRLYINGAMAERQPTLPYLLTDPYTRPLSVPHYLETLPASAASPNPFIHHIIQRDGDNGALANTEEFDVPPDHFFFMGDNRDNSLDSRVVDGDVGFVPAEYLVGKAGLILYSIDDSVHPSEIWQWTAALRAERFVKAIR